MRRRSFLLFEALLAVVIGGGVLVLLAMTYRQRLCYHQHHTRREAAIFRHTLLSLRVKEILDRVYAGVAMDPIQPPTIWTTQSPPGIAFAYQRGLDRQHHFSGQRVSLLCFSPTAQQLLWITWGAEKKVRCQVLDRDVSAVEMALFDRQQCCWRSQWSGTWHDLAFLRLRIQRQQGDWERWLFFLPLTQPFLL